MDAEKIVMGKPDLRPYLGKNVHIIVDRPHGSIHPRHPDIEYGVNYGFIQETTSGDGMPIDAYLLGVDEPVAEADGIVIAIVVRNDDVEDKLVVYTGTGEIDAEFVQRAIAFQEKYFKSNLITASNSG